MFHTGTLFLIGVTVECRYNAVQYCKILHKLLQELRQNINQMLDPQKTPHTPPLRASYGVSFVNNCEKIERVITALHCIINSLAPGRCDCNLKSVISEHMLQIKFMSSTSVEIALRWMPQNTFDDKSTLVQVIAWWHQSTGLYMSQCWPRYMSPYGATRSNKLRQKSFPFCHHIFDPMWNPIFAAINDFH